MKVGRAAAAVLVEPRDGEDRQHALAVELLVLGREGVDRGRDDRDLLVEPLPLEGLAREDVGVRVADVGDEELPRPARERVGPVEADVTAPHRRAADVADRRDQAGRLRVVDDHHVLGLDELPELGGVALGHLVKDAARVVVEVAAIAGRAVQEVVDPLGEDEEVLVALDHHPARVDAGPARVGEQRDEHLGNAAAAGGRVDVPYDAPVEHLAAAPHGAQDALVVLGREHRSEALQVECADGHVGERGHRRRS